MTITSSEILAETAAFESEPTRVMSYSMDLQERLFNGEEIHVDPSTPFVQLTEMNVILSTRAIQKNEILDYRAYPNMAQGEADLKFHKSDRDYEGDFTTPAGAWFDLYFQLDEIYAKAVQIGQTKTRKLTIPRHSKITYNGTVFTAQYPINFIVKGYGGLDIIYDNSRPSPLQALDGNVVDWDIIQTPLATSTEGMIRQVRLRVFLKQMTLSSTQHSLSDAKILRKTMVFTDSFYYVRAFMRRSGAWVEIKTTNSQQVFDPADPTLLYDILGNEITIEMPYVYTKTGAVSDSIRVDVYTTKGPMEMTFEGSTPSMFVATWDDLDKDDAGIYYAPLKTMSGISVFSDDIVSGGTSAPSFEVKRERIKNNAIGDQVIPVSVAQMGTTLQEAGFDCLQAADDVTHLIWLTSKAMPANSKGLSSTGIDSSILTMKMTIEDVVQYATVKDNGQRVTVTPKTLYQYVDGVIHIVPDAVREAIDLLSGDAKVNRINGQNFLWTPLHYVLDTDDEDFVSRPYYLSAPTFDITDWVASNNTLGLTIGSSKEKSIVKDDDGYLLRIKTASNAAWKALKDEQVHVQLGFSPAGDSAHAFINGTQVAIDPADGERIFEFRINSNWDVTPEDALITTNFTLFEDVPRKLETALRSDFTVIWAVSDYEVEGSETTTIDQVMGTWLLPLGTKGVYQEMLNIKLGSSLTGLWARCRSMIGNRKYATYETDVYKTHEKNVYEYDNSTVPPTPVIVEVDGVKSLVIIHKKGDVELGGDGLPIVKHEAGTAVLDQYGNPILESERKIVRWWDVTLFDAVYRYATNDNDVEYATNAPKIIVEWITDTLAGIKKLLLVDGQFLFQPRTTLKYVDTRVEDSELKSMHTAQRLVIDLYVTKDVYTDMDLREDLKEAAIAQTVAGLDSSSVVRSVIERSITNSLGTDIIGVHLSGLGGIDNDYNVIVMLDETTRLCVASALEVQADGKYAVVDAIEVNFKMNDERAA